MKLGCDIEGRNRRAYMAVRGKENLRIFFSVVWMFK